MKRFWLLAALVLLIPCAAAAEVFSLPVTGGAVEVCVTELSGENWLFLPAFADVDALFPEREALDDGWQVQDENGDTLHVMQSANLRALFLISDDPVNEGRAFIENCEKHANETTGYMALISTEGKVDHSGDLRQIRGRGNGTWVHPKRPYQIKLEEKADLLNTGDPDERNRTWVLLAEATDGTMLHNKLAFDLGLELGVENTSHSEFVDLYYDGDYRGTYLLAEKVEIGTGRIEGRDYDDLVEEWNRTVGITDLESLPVGTAENRFGKSFTYIEGLQDSGWLDAGTYMLEMEAHWGTLSDRCWFHMMDNYTIALKNPENASETMMRYISERLTEARATLQNKGVNPENGRTIEDDFNVDAFARLALINELAYNIDGFVYSSTWFVLPEGADRFEPGPPWDFDLAWRYLTSGKNVTGVKDETGWLPDFYQCRTFFDRVYQIYRDELYPMVTEILLGEGEGRYLRSLAAYEAEIAQSAYLNSILWPVTKIERLIYGENWQEEHALLRQFITERSEWMYRSIVKERENSADGVQLSFEVIWGHPHDGLDIRVIPWSDVQLVSYESSIYQEATEEDYAIWQVEMLFAPPEGKAFDGTTSIVNGQELEAELLEDGRLRLLIAFEDLSYRPVDYYGEDIGLIYNYDFYIQKHPEVLDICGDDPEAVMDYFCDEGMYEDHQGNAFFRPSEVLLYNDTLKSYLGTDWQNYYWDFLGYGHDEGWMLTVGKHYEPEVWSLQ